MSYAVVQRPALISCYPPLGSVDGGSAGSWIVPVLIGVSVLGLVGFFVYERMQLTKQIVHEQGVGKALEFEGGIAAIGVLSQALTRNKRRRARRRAR